MQVPAPDIGEEWLHLGTPIEYSDDSEEFTISPFGPTIPPIRDIIGDPSTDNLPDSPRTGGRTAVLRSLVINKDTGIDI